MIDSGEGRPSFGALLRRYRSRARLSQAELAEQSGISVSAIGVLERGARRAPQPDTLARLVSALHLSAADRVALEFAAIQSQARTSKKSGIGAGAASNLPAQVTSLVGRQSDIRSIAALVRTCRLVTVVGSGGVGKTRAALAVAEQMLRGGFGEVWLVNLAPIAEGAFIPATIAAELGLFGTTVDSLDELLAALKTRSALIVLDNCEHVIEEAAIAAQRIVEACPGIRILATSRERLRTSSESTYRLPSLELPTAATAPAQATAAVKLFLQRAASAGWRHVLTTGQQLIVAAICLQLDGIPLAIELAAAQVPTLGLESLRVRLTERLGPEGISRDRPARHQTVAATIDWSYSLLTKREQTLLRRAAVFRGNFSLEAVEGVCTGPDLDVIQIPELLVSLVEKSLIAVIRVEQSVRYTMLETVRHYCRDLLALLEELVPVSRRHAEWFASFADSADVLYLEIPLNTWLVRVAPEIDNVRAALSWSLSTGCPGDAVLAGRTVGGLRALWLLLRYVVECRRWVESALAQLDESDHPLIVTRLLRALLQCVEGGERIAVARRARPLFERFDRRGLAILEISLLRSLTWRGQLAEAERAAAVAERLLTEDGLRHSLLYANFLIMRSSVRCARQLYDEARADIAASERIASALGDAQFVNWCEALLIEVEFCAAEFARAAEIAQSVIARHDARMQDDARLNTVFSALACCRLRLGDLRGAKSAAQEMLSLSNGRDPVETVMAIQHLAAIAALEGRSEMGARHLGFVDSWCERMDYWRTPIEVASYETLRTAVANAPAGDRIERLKAAGRASSLEAVIREARSQPP